MRVKTIKSFVSVLIFITAIVLFSTAAFSAERDFPHYYRCAYCHYINLYSLLDMVPQNPDETDYNNLCNSCHIGGPGFAPLARTHSSAKLGTTYGNWTMECRVCHDPHQQRQMRTYPSQYPAGSYLFSGNSDNPGGISGDLRTLTDSGANFDRDLTGMILIPDTGDQTSNYEITVNTATSITVGMDMDLAGDGDPYAVVYGNLLKETIDISEIIISVHTSVSTSLPDSFTLFDDQADWTTDQYAGYEIVPDASVPLLKYTIASNTHNTITASTAMSSDIQAPRVYQITTPKSGNMTVRFFNNTGANSFSDGDSTYDGICEVCHTQTNHFRNDGNAPDQLHSTVGGMSGQGGAGGTNCINCHMHVEGFGHGAGDDTGCEECHGHDPGYGGVTGGAGTFLAHSTHTENDSDDLRGPNIECSGCHDINNYPLFSDGNILSATTVCDTCHSPNGTYDGVNDSVTGAKNNWVNGVYETDGALTAGKEKWCATCHDELPSQIQSVNAPNVTGDENGAYTYGTGWGFYKTGHGLPSGQSYPASGGVTAGADKTCLDCHDSTASHIDGSARTFDDGDSSTLDPGFYRLGYRLKQVGGNEPMLIPWPSTTANAAANYRLCISCHVEGPFTDSGNMNTNLVTNSVNRHEYHLNLFDTYYASDWSGGSNSRITCVSCHNVHGSTRLAMVRDGKLTGQEPGLMIWYNNDALVSYDITNTDPPTPENLPLSASTGTVWRGLTAGNLCEHCHDNDNTLPEYRTPFQNIDQSPTLDWTGEIGYVSDGVNPDTGPGGTVFEFRVEYTDSNNDAPATIEVWVDENDNETDEPGEYYAMTGADSADTQYTDGKLYTRSLTINKGNDNSIDYRFSASDGTNSAAGAPTSNSAFTVTNNAPALSWTGEQYFVTDGVNPDTGGDGSSFTFRVMYTDTDNEGPSTPVQVWVDTNGDIDYDDPGEKQDMTVDGGDGNYSNGENYTKTMTLSYVAATGGVLNYTFRASDGTDNATGGPVADNTVTVLVTAGTPPFMDWVSDNCRIDGVKPGTGFMTADFEFKVQYTDPGNTAPSTIEVWVDVNGDNDNYEDPGEKLAMTIQGGDGDYTNGEIYTATVALNTAGTIKYRFYATNGTDDAIGDPAAIEKNVTVRSNSDTRGVRTGTGDSGPDWYNSIQSAIDAVNGAHTVLVYEGTYNESIALDGINDDSTTVQSVCGRDTATINGSGDVVDFQWDNSGSVIDGFTITGGTRGVSLNGSTPTVQNCKIHSNSNASGNGGGIYSTHDSSGITISNCEIYSNSALNGAGIFFNNGTHTITDSIIRNNTASNTGGGVLFSWTSSGTAITGTTVKDNTSTGSGGGLYIINGNADFYKCTLTGNSSSADKGGALYITGANPTFENCIIAGNQAADGGGVNVSSGSSSFINTTFAGNQAVSGDGGALRICGSTNNTIRNTIFWNNTATGSGHNIFKDCAVENAGTLTDSDVTTGAGYIDGGTFTTGSNIDPAQDPQFTGTGDYHLKSSSPAIDQANAVYAPAEDIDGDIRPAGSADDMGADEYVP